MRHHISKATGRVNICRATKRACPVGGEHFDSRAEAMAAYEAKRSSTPEPLRKASAPADTFATHDSPMPGMGRGRENLEKLQARQAAMPALSFEDRQDGGEWVTDVYANGQLSYSTPHRHEVELLDRVRDAGQWASVEAFLDQPEAVESLHDLFESHEKYGADLAEELEAMEDDVERVSQRSPREVDAHEREMDLLRLAQRVLKAEKSK